MSRRAALLLVAVLAALAGGYAMYQNTFTSDAYADYTAPTFATQATDEQRIFQLQTDLGNAAAEMAELQQMANKLQFAKMKAMGRHLQEVAAELQPRLAEIEDPVARRLLRQGIEGLRMVGEGSEELDRDKSLRGVEQVLTSFEALNSR
ncbi:MAG TPA: hypothetical protein PLT68_10180 [Actinomycetota bacterium]|nr:hypothetical protein [Actinomycetota bacterium]